MEPSKPFPSRRENSCATCNLPIHIGDMIRWTRQKGFKSLVWHDGACYDNRSKTPQVQETQEQNHFAPSTATAEKTSVSAPVNGDFLAGMANALAPYLESKLNAKVDEDTVLDLIQSEIGDALKNAALVTLQTIEVKHATGETVSVG